MSLQITINGRSLNVESGRTVLQAARENGIEIPTLCDYPGLTSHGSCRMCIVEIEGRPNAPTSCTTPVEDGMIVQTNSPKVHALRTELFKLLLSEHPASCLFCEEKSHCDECMVTLRKTGVTTGCRSCPDDGQCELQLLADRFDLAEGGYPVRYRMLPVERKDPFFDRDYNLCILCERCVRVCEENHLLSAVTLTSRGTDTVVGTPFGQSLLQSGCSFCGACVEACPTGTLSEKTRKWSGVPEREVSTTCPLCSAGCQMQLLVRNDMVIGSLPDHANGTDMLCVKGRFGITELVNHPKRLQQPTVLSQEGSLPVKWEEAIEMAAEKIAACDPQKYGLVLSADCSSETLYIAQKFARQVMRSKSIHLSSAAAYRRGLPIIERLYGTSSPLSALSTADTILCLGFDGRYAQSVVETELHRAKRRGAKLITFDSRSHSLRKSADEWLHLAAGEEADLLEILVEIVSVRATTPQLWPIPPQAQRSARLLMEAKHPVILVGSALLTDPDNVFLLKMVEKLMTQLHAQLILLPEKSNLGGALQMGITTPISTARLRGLDVLHIIGEAMPADLSSQPFVLYQNIYPPAAAPASGLVLPAAAFTEEDGTFIDHAGAMHRTHKAVPAPGSALPSWQILCHIAQKLGVAGFDYEDAEQIRAEMESIPLAGAEPDDPILSLFRPSAAVFPSSHMEDHGYMGYPLRTWVPGFQVLCPDPALRIK
jgi:predicted molibdopterin-dependent oxidoreductase YjgC